MLQLDAEGEISYSTAPKWIKTASALEKNAGIDSQSGRDRNGHILYFSNYCKHSYAGAAIFNSSLVYLQLNLSLTWFNLSLE